MKPSEILRLAARHVENNPYRCGCPAIAHVMGRFEEWHSGLGSSRGWGVPEDVMEYFGLVGPKRPTSKLTSELWWGEGRPENAGPRIIGLCLAAAIAESEGQ